jgi:branched-chain amino acid transport system substrate-binding protein
MRKRRIHAISTVAIVIVVVIIVVVAGVGAYYLATQTKTTSSTTSGVSSSSCNTSQAVFCFPKIAKGSNATFSGNKTVTIGVLTETTDGLSAIGAQIGDAAQIAASNVNAWIKANDTSWSGSIYFKVAVENYAGLSSTAMTQLGTFQTEGITAVVGPLDSSTLGAIYSTAASDGIVLISPSSTAVTLSGVSPYVYRTVPNDGFQGLADAREMYQDGVRQLIIVYTNQAYGSGLANTTASRFTQLGGTVVAKIPYDPTTVDFTSTLASMNQEYQTAVSNAGGNKSEVAIQAIGYQEIGDMLTQAQSSYPQLLNTTQPWYGTDGESDSPAFVNSTYSAVSAEVRLPATFYAPSNSSDSNLVCAATNALSATGCDPYSQAAYDSVWLAADSILRCGTTSGSCLSTSIGVVANESVGVTGPMTLGSDHDRVASSYDIYAVATVSGTVSWLLAGTWSYATDTVTWTSPPKY